MYKIEKLCYDFFARIPELRNMDYWTKLSKLKILSQERRMERYRIISVWKCLEGLTPDCGLEASEEEGRLGRRCRVPALLPGGRAAVQTLREQGFQINGPRLFNQLPKKIRNIRRSQEDFKKALDVFLMSVPDQPRMAGLVPDHRTPVQLPAGLGNYTAELRPLELFNPVLTMSGLTLVV